MQIYCAGAENPHANYTDPIHQNHSFFLDVPKDDNTLEVIDLVLLCFNRDIKRQAV